MRASSAARYYVDERWPWWGVSFLSWLLIVSGLRNLTRGGCFCSWVTIRAEGRSWQAGGELNAAAICICALMVPCVVWGLFEARADGASQR